MSRILIPLLALALAASARADVVLGKKSSCSAVWDSGTAAVTLGTVPTLSCTDGDPSCDTDGAVNGSCTLSVKACNGTDAGSCTPTPLASGLKFNAKASAAGFSDPGAGACAEGRVTLALKRHPHNPRKTLKKYTPSRPAILKMRAKHFANILKLRCLPCTGTTCSTTTTTTLPTCGADTAGELDIEVPLADRAHPELGNGSDLDNGWTGTSHNFPVIGGSVLRYCLTGCDGKTTFDCQGSGSTAANGDTMALNGATFGAPLPLLAANVPVCVVNAFQQPTLSGTFNLQTGDSGTQQNPNRVPLFSKVYLRTTFSEVCPRCSGSGIGAKGTCSSTAKNAGDPCTVDGEVTVAGKGLYELSSACTPLGDSPPTTLDIQLAFTTGTTSSAAGPKPCPGQTQDDACGQGQCNAGCTGAACVATSNGQCIDAKGGISQLCCSTNTGTPCFSTRNGGAITRIGTPAAPGGTQVAASTFCIAATDSSVINVTTGLPGPGALLLPGKVTFTPTKN